MDEVVCPNTVRFQMQNALVVTQTNEFQVYSVGDTQIDSDSEIGPLDSLVVTLVGIFRVLCSAV